MIELLLYKAAGQSPLATALIWVLFAIVIIGLVLLVIWQKKAGEKLSYELLQLGKVKKHNVQNEFVLKALHIASWHMIVATHQITYDYDFRERNNDWVADSNDFDDKESGLALLHEQDAIQVAKAMEDICSGKTEFYHETYRVRVPGTDKLYWEESYATVAERGVDGLPTVIVGTSKRIDDRKKMEQALVEARNRAEESDRLKSAFLANISHEIRTPLNAIVGFTSVIPDVEDKNERQELLNLIQENTQKLLRIINDVVNISKVESGKEAPVMSTFDLTIVLQQVIDEFVPKIPSGVQLVTEYAAPQQMITTDMARLKEVMTHLVSNAVKFTAQGTITVGFDLPPTENHINIWVKDTGKGISKEHIERVFERFFKVDEFIPGAGLGLSISRTMAESVGGSVTCVSKLGEGSTFTCQLPV